MCIGAKQGTNILMARLRSELRWVACTQGAHRTCRQTPQRCVRGHRGLVFFFPLGKKRKPTRDDLPSGGKRGGGWSRRLGDLLHIRCARRKRGWWVPSAVEHAGARNRFAPCVAPSAAVLCRSPQWRWPVMVTSWRIHLLLMCDGA